MTMVRRGVCLALVVLLLGWAAGAQADRFDELAERYSRRAGGREASSALESELKGEAHGGAPLALWRSLFSGDIPPRQGAANALALVETLFPDGDPAQWDGVSGFLRPSLVPGSLAAADAVVMAARFLLEMEDRSGDALALELMERFIRSSRAKYHFVSTRPRQLDALLREMERRGLTPAMGQWPPAMSVTGSLPFASPFRGYVTMNRALLEEMVFMNAAGQLRPHGIYAWNRRRGGVYEVTQDKRPFFFRYR